jgi:geranylgeranyl diphosphate synthase type II
MASIHSVVDIAEWRESTRRTAQPTEQEDPVLAELQLAFRSRLHLPRNLERTFDGALRYLLDRSGGMVRPRIVYLVASAYGIEKQAAIDLAIALEYFHTASLVFDDLPCMDNGAMRRGAPCVHLPYGESGAILAALELINRAYALIWRAVSVCPQAMRESALVYLECHLGTEGLLNGQSLDLNYQAFPRTLESTEQVARGKTVSLILLTLVLPAKIGGASRRELQLLERISTCWGLGYQIVDDLKDVLQSSSIIGKTAARDLELDRPNIALAIGVRASVERLARLLHVGDRALDALLQRRDSLVFLREFRAALTDELTRVIEGAGALSALAR